MLFQPHSMSLAFRSKLLVLAAAVSATHAQGGRKFVDDINTQVIHIVY